MNVSRSLACRAALDILAKNTNKNAEQDQRSRKRFEPKMLFIQKSSN